MIRIIKNILCRFFGHQFPSGGSYDSLIRDGELPCHRCGESKFGKDPYKKFGGYEEFIKDNFVK